MGERLRLPSVAAKSPPGIRLSGPVSRRSFMVAIGAILAFVIVFGALNAFEFGRLD
jgi:hypothetical protein